MCGLLVTVSARGATNDGSAATPQSIINGAPLMTSPVVPVYQHQPLIPTFHPQYTPVCMNELWE